MCCTSNACPPSLTISLCAMFRIFLCKSCKIFKILPVGYARYFSRSGFFATHARQDLNMEGQQSTRIRLFSLCILIKYRGVHCIQHKYIQWSGTVRDIQPDQICHIFGQISLLSTRQIFSSVPVSLSRRHFIWPAEASQPHMKVNFLPVLHRQHIRT